jgi:hypothetical protein
MVTTAWNGRSNSTSYGSNVGVDATTVTLLPAAKMDPSTVMGAVGPMVWCSVTTGNPEGESRAGDGTLVTG